MRIDFKNILKINGFKSTPSRISILELFSSDCKPVNAEDIFRKVNKITDQVTVYRTLNSFEEKGILRRVDLRKGSAYYELNTKHHHHHIVCKKCGLIEIFDGCEIDKISKKILSKSLKFKNITEHSFELFGLCKTCTK